MFAYKILIADDQKTIRHSLHVFLRHHGFKVYEADGPESVLETIRKELMHLLIIDLNYTRDTTSGTEGLALLEQIKQIAPNVPVLVITAFGNVEIAVEAMRRGAQDFVEKPWDNNRLLASVNNLVKLQKSESHVQRYRAQLKQDLNQSVSTMVAESPAMQSILNLVRNVADSDASIIILGENGTGKSLLAKMIHQRSRRFEKPFVAVNTGGLSEGLFESEMFGHVKGAFTDARDHRVGRFEMAEEGTLFLDEIANIPLKQQNKLLRVLEMGLYEPVGSSKTYQSDVRIVSATNATMTTEIEEGRFRRDLYYRLNTIEITMPPLRERLEDIPVLSRFFLARLAEKYRKPVLKLTARMEADLLQYSWPGNIRELEHAMERMILLGQNASIFDHANYANPDMSPTTSLNCMSLLDIEGYMIKRTLKENQGNITKTAKALGLSRSAMYRRLQKHEI